MEEEDANRRHNKVVRGRLPIRGMESVIATVSGYHGTERFNLIKLIDKIGASYVGSMNQSITHLVCWRFEGKKYELAKKFKMSIINHKWVEDCIKNRRRLPEAPYTFQCGQEVGPLMLDNTLFREIIQLNHSKEPAIHIESEEDFNSWTDSTLLKENLSPEMGKYKDRPRRKSNVNSMNEDHPSSSKYCSDEHSLQGPHRTEIEELNFPSSASLKPKKRSSDSETSRRSRRLVKNISGDLVEIISGSEKQSFRIQARQELETSAQFYNSDVEMEEISVNNRHGSSFSCYQSEPSRIDLDGIEETEVNRLLDNGDQSLHVESASSNLTGNRQETCPAVDEVQNETDNTCKVSTSTALSCVICWTDFSSSRGMLPCGHRFCFSCIQTWANHMASSRKVSTCPLCKASFVAIRKVDDVFPADQKIYTQTIPEHNPEMDIYILPEGVAPRFPSNSSRTPVCCRCSCREPEDLLVKCHLCETLSIHSFCLDPPLFPWTCMHCKDLQRLYRRSWSRNRIHKEIIGEILIVWYSHGVPKIDMIDRSTKVEQTVDYTRLEYGNKRKKTISLSSAPTTVLDIHVLGTSDQPVPADTSFPVATSDLISTIYVATTSVPASGQSIHRDAAELFSTQPHVSTEPHVDPSIERDNEYENEEDDGSKRQSKEEPVSDVGDDDLESSC
ncbi:hypothetical protein K7X08_033678 [Anisodus acutangulus]|uniref:RING-type E3 ubiquitin transferase BRCA1 n=1 Tax=Anisodus acutangulus TaxID=402998 RepID=A0A9Q1M609_9SOLA|nr:hypothetical protein K7X08_033678 [Anisodus acutangulus]